MVIATYSTSQTTLLMERNLTSFATGRILKAVKSKGFLIDLPMMIALFLAKDNAETPKLKDKKAGKSKET